MFAKKLVGLLLATVFFMSAGCCRFCDRWCNDRHHYQQPGVCCPPVPCCPTPAPTCPPPSYSSPAGAVPVPAAPNSSWVRPCP